MRLQPVRQFPPPSGQMGDGIGTFDTSLVQWISDTALLAQQSTRPQVARLDVRRGTGWATAGILALPLQGPSGDIDHILCHLYCV